MGHPRGPGVELKAIDLPGEHSGFHGEADARASVTAACFILTAEGTKQLRTPRLLWCPLQAEILRAEGDKEQCAELRAQGAGGGHPDPSSTRSTSAIPTVSKLLAYQYLQTLPKIADSASSKLWIIPSQSPRHSRA